MAYFSDNLLKQYYKEIRATALLSKEEELLCARKAKKGDLAARKRMIQANLRLVVKIAKRYSNSPLPILDIIEEGNLGLIHAVEKFDPEKGFRFSTYAAYWIQQTIERSIMNHSRTIRIPVHIIKQVNAFLKNEKTLPSKTHQLIEMARALSHSNEELEQIPLPSSTHSNPFDKQYSADLNQQMMRWLDHLSPKLREVISRRFGLLGHDASTLDETGIEIGLTRERVRQLQSQALRQLRKLIENDGEDEETLLN